MPLTMLPDGNFSPGDPPGFKQHCLTTIMIRNFEKEIEDTHMKWLEEVLIEAKKYFGHDDHHLLPKTTTQENKRKRGRKKKCESDSSSGKESPTLVAAKRCKANTTLETSPSKETVDSCGLPPPAESSDASATSAISGSGSEDGEQRGVTASCESHLAEVDEELPVRRSTRKRFAPAKTTRSTRSTRSGKDNTGRSSDESRSVQPQNKKAKPEVKKEEKVDEAIIRSESELANVMDPPPRNSPRREIESYYKDRVKRLINHHEKMMTHTSCSEDEFTPPNPKRVRVQKKQRTSNTSPRRSIRSKKTKQVGEKSKINTSKGETETDDERLIGHKNVDEVISYKKIADQHTIPDVSKGADNEKQDIGTSVAKLPLTDTPVQKQTGNIEGTSEVYCKAAQNISTPKEIVSPSKGLVHRVFGITGKIPANACTPQKPPRATPAMPEPLGTPPTRSSRSRIVKPIRGGGGGKTRESQHEQVETEEKPSVEQEVSETGSKGRAEDEEKVETRNDGETGSKSLEDEKSSDEQKIINGKDPNDERPNSDLQKGSTNSESEVPETPQEKEISTLEKYEGSVVIVDDSPKEDYEDEVIPPSPKTERSESTISSDSPSSEDQRVPRQSSRQSTAGKRQRSSIMKSRSKSRSSNYHRFKTRQSRVSTIGIQELGATISEESHEERRVTRSRAKRVSEAADNLVKENTTVKRKSSDSDDACRGMATNAALTGRKKSPEEQRFTPDNYDRTMHPRVKSFLNPSSVMKKNSLHIYKNGQVTSFIKRNTPLKKTQRDRKQEIVEKQRREEEVKRKLDDERKQRLEEIKQKREERARRVAEARARRIQIQSDKKRRLEEQQEQKMALSNKQKQEKRKEELEKRLKLTKKKVEAEERRRQEEEARLQKFREQEELNKRQDDFIQRKREYEEKERNRKLEESRRHAEQRRLEADKQREEEERKKDLQNMAHEREMQERKEEREREQKGLDKKRLAEAGQRERDRKDRDAVEAERLQSAQRALRDRERQEELRHLNEMMKKEKERQDMEKLREKEKAEQERLKASILKHNTSINQPSKNVPATINESKTSPTSYEMTPQRIYVAVSDVNYGIDDINSGDSTDDEDHPRKTIPSWAQGADLRNGCVRQHLDPPDLDFLFPPIEAPNLELLFAKKRARFFKRTSSAVWNSPPESLNHRR